MSRGPNPDERQSAITCTILFATETPISRAVTCNWKIQRAFIFRLTSVSAWMSKSGQIAWCINPICWIRTYPGRLLDGILWQEDEDIAAGWTRISNHQSFFRHKTGKLPFSFFCPWKDLPKSIWGNARYSSSQFEVKANCCLRSDGQKTDSIERLAVALSVFHPYRKNTKWKLRLLMVRQRL